MLVTTPSVQLTFVQVPFPNGSNLITLGLTSLAAQGSLDGSVHPLTFPAYPGRD